MKRTVKNDSRICAVCHKSTQDNISKRVRFRDRVSELYFHEPCKETYDFQQENPNLDYADYLAIRKMIRNGL